MRYRCTECDEVFESSMAVDDHLYNHHFSPSDYIEEIPDEPLAD